MWTRGDAVLVGFEPSMSSDRTALCAKQRAPSYATHALYRCASGPRAVELVTCSNVGLRVVVATYSFFDLLGPQLETLYNWDFVLLERARVRVGTVGYIPGPAVTL